MTPFDKFLQWLLTITVWDVVKVLLLIGLGLYVVFAIVMVRQVDLMRATVKVEQDWWVALLAWLHLLAAVTVMVVAMVTL